MDPTVSPAPPGVVAAVKFKVELLVALTHAVEFAFKSATAQEVVLNICKRGASFKFDPILLNRIVG